jgi:hypothetical protein
VSVGPRVIRQSESFGALALFVLATGVALVFSMPSATYVREIFQTPLSRGTPVAFFVVYALACVFYSVSRGASAASSMGRTAAGLLAAAVHVAMAFVLTVPFFVYIRIVLLPLDRITILWSAGYCLVVSLSFALFGYWLELRSLRCGRESALDRYGLACAVIALPVAFRFAPGTVALLSLASPLTATLTLFRGPSTAEALVLFGLPAVASLFAVLLIRREGRLELVRL